MIQQLILIFSMMTLLFIPVYIHYSQGTALIDSEKFLATLSIGNLGHAEPICIHHYISINKSDTLKCEIAIHLRINGFRNALISISILNKWNKFSQKCAKSLWQLWIDYKAQNKDQHHSNESFKRYLKQQLQQQIQSLPCALAGHENEQIEIAAIYFGYDHTDIIEGLKKRGQAILDDDNEQIKQNENHLLINVSRNRNKYSTPVCGFVIFQTQEAYERCIQYLETQYTFFGTPKLNTSSYKFLLLGEQQEIMKGVEPSNIIWENLPIQKSTLTRNKLLALFLNTVLLIMIMIAIGSLKVKVVWLDKKYPISNNCEHIADYFLNTTQFKQYAQQDQIQTLAWRGYGNYQCYCQMYGQQDKELCQSYLNDKYYTTFLSSMVTALIVILNMILKIINVKVINMIGYDYRSQVISKIVISVFFSQFINTAFILVISSANFQNTPLSFLPVYNHYPDFTKDWYLEIGSQIVVTMFVTAWMPYIEFLTAYIPLFIKRIMDSGLSIFGSQSATKKNTIHQYVKLYAGPDVYLHFRYGQILCFIYISFTYGLAMPILFPITLLHLCNLYIVERLQFAYFYQKPPMIDNVLNDLGLTKLQYAPIMMMLFGYWQLGNRQIFLNEITTIEYKSDTYDPNHKLFQINVIHTVLFIIFFFLFLFFFTYVKVLSKIGKCFKFYRNLSTVDDNFNFKPQIDENLGNYWQALSGRDQYTWFTKEVYLQKQLNICTLEPTELELLRTSKKCGKIITNIPNYDILQNTLYTSQFGYIQEALRKVNQTSDFISRLIYLGEDLIDDNLEDQIQGIRKYSKQQPDQEDIGFQEQETFRSKVLEESSRAVEDQNQEVSEEGNEVNELKSEMDKVDEIEEREEREQSEEDVFAVRGKDDGSIQSLEEDNIQQEENQQEDIGFYELENVQKDSQEIEDHQKSQEIEQNEEVVNEVEQMIDNQIHEENNDQQENINQQLEQNNQSNKSEQQNEQVAYQEEQQSFKEQGDLSKSVKSCDMPQVQFLQTL